MYKSIEINIKMKPKYKIIQLKVRNIRHDHIKPEFSHMSYFLKLLVQKCSTLEKKIFFNIISIINDQLRKARM